MLEEDIDLKLVGTVTRVQNLFANASLKIFSWFFQSLKEILLFLCCNNQTWQFFLDSLFISLYISLQNLDHHWG